MNSTLKKRIAILTWELYPLYVGGLGMLTKNVVDELQKQALEVTPILPFIPDDINLPGAVSLEKELNKYLGTRNIIPNLPFTLNYFNPKQKSPQIGQKPIFSRLQTIGAKYNLYPNNTPQITRAFAMAFVNYLQENTFDYVIGMDWMCLPSMFAMKQSDFKIPFFSYVNSTEVDRSPDKRNSTIEQIINLENHFCDADHIIAISEITKLVLTRQYKVPLEKITIVYNDINFTPETNHFKGLKTGKNVLYIGRITPQKGLSFLLDTINKVVEYDPEIRFIIAGDGDMMEELIKTICEQKLEKNVIITGWVENEDKGQLYKSSDIFVMPSPSEPFGLTALEAIKSGVPVISSKHCGFLGVVPATPTFDYYDINNFSELILFYLNHDKWRKKLLEKQQKQLTLHSWEDQVSKITKLTR
jgi:glycosyltransferase involved in cell wall biosynthesis